MDLGRKTTETTPGLAARVARDFFVMASLMPLFFFGWFIAFYSVSGYGWGLVGAFVTTLVASAIMTVLGIIVLAVRQQKQQEIALYVILTVIAAIPMPLAWLIFF